MPQFPRHSSQRSLTTQQPEPLRREAGEQAGVATEALGAVQKMAVTLDNAMITAQVNSFKANKGVFLTDLKNRAALDPDQNAKDKYFKELSDYQKNALKDMSPRARQEAQLELQSDARLSQIWLEGTFFKKQANEAVKNLAVGVEGKLNNALMSTTPRDFSYQATQAMQQIRDNLAAGFITPDEGKRMQEKFKEDLRLGVIDRDLYNAPEDFKANAKEGKYQFKNKKEESDKLAKADALIKAEEAHEKWQATQVNTLGCYDLSNALLTGTINHNLITEMNRQGQIDDETAAIFDQIIVKGEYAIPKDPTQPDYFLRLLDESLDDKTESLDIMKRAAQSYGNKEMGSSQYAWFVGEAKRKLDQQQKGDATGNKVFKGCISALKGYAKLVNPKTYVNVAAGMAKEFINKTQSGVAPQAALNEVVKEQISVMHPATNFLNDVPNAVISEKEDLSVIFDAPSKATATHVWRNGKLVAAKDR